MKSITGLNSFKSRKVRILGHDLKTEFRAAMKNVGSIIETADVYEYISPYTNLKFVARFHKNVTENDNKESLNMVNLTKYKNEKVSKFSLGMKQRLALAMALLSKPELVILDEPTNGEKLENIKVKFNSLEDFYMNEIKKGANNNG